MKTKTHLFFGVIAVLLLGTTVLRADTATQLINTSGSLSPTTTSTNITNTSGTSNTSGPSNTTTTTNTDKEALTSTTSSAAVFPTTSGTTNTATINTTTPLLEMMVFPQTITIYIGNKIQFKAGTNTKIFDGVAWSVAESSGGTIDASGTYTTPTTPGIYHIIARFNGYKIAYASVAIIPPPLEERPATTNTTNTTVTVPNTTIIPSQPTANPIVTPIQFTPTTKTQIEEPRIIPPTGVEAPKATLPIIPKNSLAPSTTTLPISTSAGNRFATTTPVEIQKNIRIGDLTSTLKIINTNVQENKKDLLRVIDERIALVSTNTDLSNQTAKIEQLKTLRENINTKLESNLTKNTAFTKINADNLTTTVKDDLKNIDTLVQTINPKLPENITPLEKTKAVEIIAKTITDQSEILKNQDADLLYKDSNNDGVSDYDSVHIYNMDPIKPSPVSTFEGKQLTAKDKIILGFDPTKPELQKVAHEEPFTVLVPIASTYTVDNVKLDKDKNITMKGQALPNSFVTIYVFSTPIIVTVKTDENGDWQYTLNKEIENGEHMIYTASVDNSGKILTRSTVFPFVKTAQAATLETNLLAPNETPSKPSFFDLNTILIIFISFVILVSSAIYIIGTAYKAKAAEQTDNTPTNPPVTLQ